MKKMKKKKEKELKKIDIERLVYRVAIVSNLLLWILVVLNASLWHNQFLSGITTGWNLCLIVMMIAVSIAGHKNFKYEMNRLADEWLKLHEEMVGRGMKDAKKKLQSGREQDTTNDNK